jgi:hypothetical protein
MESHRNYMLNPDPAVETAATENTKPHLRGVPPQVEGTLKIVEIERCEFWFKAWEGRLPDLRRREFIRQGTILGSRGF